MKIEEKEGGEKVDEEEEEIGWKGSVQNFFLKKETSERGRGKGKER